MDCSKLVVRTLICEIPDIKGFILPCGISFLISEKTTDSVPLKFKNCFIYLDKGKNCFEDFKRHVVDKKLLYENSI